MIVTRFVAAALLLICNLSETVGQSPINCALIGTRANGNGQSNQCPNNGGAMATNFTGTPYATVPAGAKTADINFRYTNATVTLQPYAITKIFITTNGVTTQIANSAGPAGAPVASGQDVLVKYCIYGSSNLPTAGTISFQFTNVQTGVAARTCSYDAACLSNCALLNNPVLLPLTFSAITIKETPNSAILQWNTDTDPNTKGFEIQNSNDGINYVKSGYVPYTVSSSGLTNSFTFTDEQIDGGLVKYYRIKVINKDDQHYYSSIKTFQRTTFGANIMISVMGNTPVVSQGSSRNKLIVNLRNNQGTLLQNVEFSDATFRLRQLNNGIYYITIKNGNSVVTTKKIAIFR